MLSRKINSSAKSVYLKMVVMMKKMIMMMMTIRIMMIMKGATIPRK